MKKLHLIAAVAALSITASIAGIAYASSDRHEYRMNDRMERMAEHLNLTTEQQAQIKEMIDKQMEARKSERNRMQENIRSVLNEEQKTAFDEMRSKHDKRMQKRLAKHGDSEYCDHEKGHYRHGYEDRDDD